MKRGSIIYTVPKFVLVGCGYYMAEKVSKWVKFKKFLKRNMTPTWAKHISYQIFAFIVSVAMVIGVADYAVTKSYDRPHSAARGASASRAWTHSRPARSRRRRS